MGLFDYTNPGAFTMNLGNDTNSFNFGGETHRKDSPFARWDNDYSSSAFTPYVPYTSANEEDTIDERPNSMAGLQAILSKFDEDGRYGIGAPEKKKAMYAGLGQLFKTVGQAGMAGATGGTEEMGKAFNLLPTAYGQGYEKNIEQRGQRKLAAELAKLDITDKYTEAEKDKIALQLAQDQYEERTVSRKVMKEAFDQAMPPEKKDEILSHVPEHARSFAAIEWASAEALLELGQPEKAMERFNAVLGRLPEEYKLKLDQDSARAREIAKDTAGGQNDAQLELLENLKKQFPGQENNIRFRPNGDPFIATGRDLKDESNRDRLVESQIASNRDLIGGRGGGADASGLTPAARASRQKSALDAIRDFNASRATNYILSPDLTILDAKTKQPVNFRGRDSGREKVVMDVLRAGQKAEEALRALRYGIPPRGPIKYDENLVGGVDPGSGTPENSDADLQAFVRQKFISSDALMNMSIPMLKINLSQWPELKGKTDDELQFLANALQNLKPR